MKNKSDEKSLISDEGLKRIDELLAQPRRNNDEWDEILDALHSGYLITIIPQKPNSVIKSCNGVFFYKDYLRAYTTMSKCTAAAREIAKTESDIKHSKVRKLTFDELTDIADLSHHNVFIDYDPDRYTISYKWETGMVEAIATARNFGEYLKALYIKSQK